MRRSALQRRLEASQSDNRKLVRLCRLTSEIAKLGNTRTTLRKIVNAAATLIGTQTAHLALADKTEQTLYGLVSSGRHHPHAPSLKTDLSQSEAAKQALRSRKPIVINRAEKDLRVNPRARELLSIGALIYVPLVSGNRSFGLLILVTHRPHVWSKQELAFAKHFADLAAVALENVRLLDRVRETERRFRSLVEHIPAIVYVCDVEPPYPTIYISPQIETMLGFPVKQWSEDAHFFMKLIHPADAKKLIHLSDEAVRTSGFAAAEYRLIDHRGEVRWFRDEAVLVRDPGGDPIAWHGVMVEISNMKKMEQPRKELQAGAKPGGRPKPHVDPPRI